MECVLQVWPYAKSENVEQAERGKNDFFFSTGATENFLFMKIAYFPRVKISILI